MKHITLFGILSAIVINIAGCSKQKADDRSYNAPVFPTTESVEIISVTTDEAISNSHYFVVNDTVGYIVAVMDNKWLHAFSLNSGKPIGSYIFVGNGPGEMYQVYNAQIDRDNGIIALNQGDKLYHYQIESNGEVSWINAVDIPRLGWRNSLYELPQTARLLIEDTAPDHSIIKKIINNGVSGPVYQNLDGEPDEILLINNGLGCYTVSPDEKRVAFMSGIGGIIQLLDISSDEIKPIKTMRYFPQEYTDKGDRRVLKKPFTLGFVSATSDADNFYGAYSGDTVDMVVGKTVNNIGVWDWEGNPVKLYTVDKGVLKIITVR